ncbi:MAG: hypothetical protein AB7H97_13020, partial [Pseudobdellovibrionaceae bacterium]
MLIRKFLFCLFMATAPSFAFAIEIHSFIGKDCDLTQGLILDVSEGQITVLTLTGDSKVLAQNAIDSILIHNTVTNPIQSIRVDPLSKAHFRDVYVGSTKELLFNGWAVKFIENLVIFMDVQGKTHVLEINDITRIRPATTDKNLFTPEYRKASFDFGDFANNCPSIKEQKGEIKSSRVLADQIQMDEFLSNLEKGFRQLDGFQERTYLYARPQLFDPNTRLGFPSYGKGGDGEPSRFPLYFQWTSGDPFRFQSLTQFGTPVVEWTPTFTPPFVIRTEVKSHLFHASFVGNLPFISAGADRFYWDPDLNFSDLAKSKSSLFAGISFNYMALMGFDWGPWSASFGTYFPIFAAYGYPQHEYREILATSVSPIFRLMYTGPNWRLRGVYSQTDNKKNSGIENKDLNHESNPEFCPTCSTESVGKSIGRFDLKSHFYRVGIDYDVLVNTRISLDQ